ncbi:MAG: aminomethyl-transferring glycine dehydrogenase [Pseudomonadota bacterium]
MDPVLQPENFINRHIGPSEDEINAMLAELGYDSLDHLSNTVVPASILDADALDLDAAHSEYQALTALRKMADKNIVNRSLIGQGYFDTITPPIIQRNVLENPGWYTAYTPYQPEISQGRLEALLNYQQMIIDLTGMEIANASLLDEASAAAEAMSLAKRISKSKSKRFLVADTVYPQTLAVIQARAEPLDIEIITCPAEEMAAEDDFYGVLLQYPDATGEVKDHSTLAASLKDKGAVICVATDLLALTLLTPPGEWGADIVLGSSQRFGVPLGFGGPHAAFFATHDAYKRSVPGRIVGVSEDASGKPAYRLALQTREQHIRRDKATSNICTAQVLLANMAGFYAVWHGPDGLKAIAERVHTYTALLAGQLEQAGYQVTGQFFDTVTITTGDKTDAILDAAEQAGINLNKQNDTTLSLSLDEKTDADEIRLLCSVFDCAVPDFATRPAARLPKNLQRKSAYLTHPVFHIHRSETEMLRYLKSLEDKDIALNRSMIPLGSCTMKLNATAEMMPVTWPEFANIHPFAPAAQTAGYRELITGLEDMLAAITGFDGVSLQPNSGATGEYAGLLVIQAWHQSRGDDHRNICLIPQSAHGTNPASAVMAGMKVVVIKCDDKGNVDLEDLKAKSEQYANTLAALMVTYPSTHGVFENDIVEICEIIHRNGGQVYMDGANLNAMVGLAKPGAFGADVMHMNLHKTFCIPHGGGGPGVGPIGVGAHLKPFLPSHPVVQTGGDQAIAPLTAAPYGSALILTISWMYIKMMGASGLKKATQIAILNANYLARRLSHGYNILYTGQDGLVAHECILDTRAFKTDLDVSVDDIAKRLMDFGFHAPTMSWPVVHTLMIEPTESESKDELDRFADAMLEIRNEIQAIADQKINLEDSPLRHAPHSLETICADHWDRQYRREQAAFPLPYLRAQKYWPPVSRIDNAFGDRNFICTCPPLEAYEDTAREAAE